MCSCAGHDSDYSVVEVALMWWHLAADNKRIAKLESALLLAREVLIMYANQRDVNGGLQATEALYYVDRILNDGMNAR